MAEVRGRLGLHAAAAGVSAVVLAPLAQPGYVLRYDMVFVPRQPLRWDLVASADTLPRAVPQDAVVSLLSAVVPGWLLQRLVLIAIIWFAVVGAGRLVPARRRLTRLVAAVGYAWTPFLAERLLLGQWGLLLAYAAFPWLIAAVVDLRSARRGSLPRLVTAAAAAAITPTGGALALLTTAVLLPARGVRARLTAAAVGAVAALNAPWMAAAAVTAAGGRSDPTGVAAFAARAENWAGPVVSLAGTGGIWNAHTTPASRASALVPIVTAGFLLLAGAGFPLLRRRWPAGLASRFGMLAVGAFLLSAAAMLPGGTSVLRWLVTEVPGAGLLRDGQKFLIPYVLCLVLCLALSAERLAARVPRPGDRFVLVGILLLPVAVLPDLAFGAAGRLRPVHYPNDWRVVARLVAAEPGPVLSLPLSMYRSYPWNHHTVVIDPAPRYFAAEVITDDTLLVGDLEVAGENTRLDRTRKLLAEGVPVTGVRWVLVQHGSGGQLPAGALAGLQVVHDGQDLSLYRTGDTELAARPAQQGRWVSALAGGMALTVLALAILSLFRSVYSVVTCRDAGRLRRA